MIGLGLFCLHQFVNVNLNLSWNRKKWALRIANCWFKMVNTTLFMVTYTYTFRHYLQTNLHYYGPHGELRVFLLKERKTTLFIIFWENYINFLETSFYFRHSLHKFWAPKYTNITFFSQFEYTDKTTICSMKIN